MSTHDLSFERYLNTQPVERVREIRRAERAWVASQLPNSYDQAQLKNAGALGDFKDQMEGYEDYPAGGSADKSREGFSY